METKAQASKRGKRSRAQGKAFERKVKEDLESKGFIVAKWTKNVEFNSTGGHLTDVKPRFNPYTHSLMMMSGGFPDFIALSCNDGFNVLGFESKMTGDLDKLEKEKCRWLLQNKVFQKIQIASKGIKRGEIIYKEFIV